MKTPFYFLFQAVGNTMVKLSAFPFLPMLSEVTVKRVFEDRLDDYERLNSNYISFFSSLDGVLGAGEFASISDPFLRVGAASYTDMEAVVEAFDGQFRDEDTPDYFNTFERQCYYVLQRKS